MTGECKCSTALLAKEGGEIEALEKMTAHRRRIVWKNSWNCQNHRLLEFHVAQVGEHRVGDPKKHTCCKGYKDELFVRVDVSDGDVSALACVGCAELTR